MDLTFHIVFCPGTVRYLRLATLSLLRHSDYRYRLVANGLDRRELAELRAFCQTSPRLEYLPFPTTILLQHGVILSLLQARETGSHFCFMDSDVFASAPFQATLEEHLAECDVFSSCSLMRWTAAESRAGYQGVSLQTPNGLPLATSFFAVYRQEVLRRVMAETRVGFEDYPWREHHDDRIVGQLAGLGIDVDDVRLFDTGKLLNVLSHRYGVRFRHAELPGLTHIGGITMGFGNYGRKEWLTRKLNRPFVLRDEALDPRRRHGSRLLWALYGPRNGSGGGREAELERRRIRLRRHWIAKYFVFFLRSLVDHAPEPRLEISDPDLKSRIVDLREVVQKTYQEWMEASGSGT